MYKKILKLITMICIVIATVLILTTISNAANLSISTSKSSVAPGETFTVTVTLNGAAGPVKATVSNGSGALSNQWLENSSATFSCTAGSSGTVTISASGTVGDFTTGDDVNVSASKSVSIVVPTPTTPTTPSNNSGGTTTTPSNNNTTTTKPSNNTTTPTKSSNSKLGSLQIAEGTLAPEFSSSVKEYSISIPNEITKLSISAVPDNSKATVKIYGNEELEIGENPIEIVVTAEDGSTTTYKLTVTRLDQELSLQSLALYYINENGERVDLNLNPEFAFNVYEYSLEKLSYTIKELKVEAISNKEAAQLEILGNTELKAGQNEITVKVTIENEDGLEEQKTYTIIVEREEEPIPAAPLTTWQKVKNWFNGAGITVSEWVTENFNKIIATMLVVATAAFVGLTIYFAYDYKNYQKLIAKLAEYNKENLMERANVALNLEKVNEENTKNDENVEKIEENINNEPQENVEEKDKIRPGKGRRFK